MGTVTRDILLAVYRRVKTESASTVEKAIGVPALRPFTIGDLQITPIPADHSAYDANMFVAEKENQRWQKRRFN